ncbi:MAG: hypothetical protein EVG15_09810 [Candidatus Acididesulfobacter diazotrophicus]|jgi:hypothetical protein|uniref:Uncharacterized protein n=1 Tax=Candidatus Acididesulfobacter diazotrophicus TaxID=2597226 RepID=A0A519BKA3_9DELT|nr:MAG: hypothetical protein EVG15_09810 [Candidatus Acididesulfobacter diazotrophicus]
MKLKDQTIKELESLEPSEIIKVYDMVIALKSVQIKSVKKAGLSYIKARKALENIKGSLGKDIVLLREERI